MGEKVILGELARGILVMFPSVSRIKVGQIARLGEHTKLRAADNNRERTIHTLAMVHRPESVAVSGLSRQ